MRCVFVYTDTALEFALEITLEQGIFIHQLHKIVSTFAQSTLERVYSDAIRGVDEDCDQAVLTYSARANE